MLAQLTYSSNRMPSCTPTEIQAILDACQRNNNHKSVTGVLLYSNTRFFQLVEGDYKTITSLYDTIKEDSRHSQVRMISLRQIKERSFPSWHMAAHEVNNAELDYQTDIKAEDKVIFDELIKGDEKEGKNALNFIKKLI